tara:strand:+ start:349 stop:540 length:192 start_codon:yes stop_codon:yes gene_type:complete
MTDLTKACEDCGDVTDARFDFCFDCGGDIPHPHHGPSFSLSVRFADYSPPLSQYKIDTQEVTL